MENKKRSLKKEKIAVSPAVGVIMMIAITVFIAAVIAVFVYGFTGDLKNAANSVLVSEDALVGSTEVNLVHYDGDSIVDAVNGATTLPIGDDDFDSSDF